MNFFALFLPKFQFLMFFRSLCIYSHPPCNKTQALKSLLCKEACLLVRNVICKKEWIQIESLRAGNLISSDVYLTDCQTFPHEFPSVKNSSCLYPEFFHGKHLSSHVFFAIFKCWLRDFLLGCTMAHRPQSGFLLHQVFSP